MRMGALAHSWPGIACIMQDTRLAPISRHGSSLLLAAQGQQGAQRIGPGQAPEVTAPQWLTLLLTGLEPKRYETWEECGNKHEQTTRFAWSWRRCLCGRCLRA